MSATNTTEKPVPVKQHKPKGPKHTPYTIFRAIMLVMIVVIFIGPLLWMLLSSFKTNVDIQNTSKAFIFDPILENYRAVLGDGGYFQFVFNSLWIGVSSTVFTNHRCARRLRDESVLDAEVGSRRIDGENHPGHQFARALVLRVR